MRADVAIISILFAPTPEGFIASFCRILLVSKSNVENRRGRCYDIPMSNTYR